MVQTFDVVVIGSGPGGYVAAIRAAQLQLKTACVEKDSQLGGTCLNVGCIPSKALLHTSESYWRCKTKGQSLGLKMERLSCDFLQMMQRKQQIVHTFQQGIAGLFKKNKVARFQGTASLLSPKRLLISKGETVEEIEAEAIILATGSEPVPLSFLPFDEKRILSSTGALALSSPPRRLLVIGAGVIGVELGSVYNRLGSEVTFVEYFDRICPTLDDSLSKELQRLLSHQGLRFYLSSKVTGAEVAEKEITLKVASSTSNFMEMKTDAVLIAIGRRPYTASLQLERLGISLTPQGLIPINAEFRTAVPSIFAIGDVVDGPMLAHKAEEEGVAVAEIIAGKHPRIHYAAIPNVVYTYPEVASVGLTKLQAEQLGLQALSGTSAFKSNSRALCSGEDEGFITIVAEQTHKKVLGVHIIGAHASELIAEGALAIRNQLTIDDIIHTPHAHPTMAEAIKEAALAIEKRAINQ